VKPALKRVLAGFLVAAGAVLGFFLAVPLARPAGTAPALVNGRGAVRLEGDAPVFAGAARVPIEIPAGAPLAGYAGFRSASAPGFLHARALALRAGPAQVVLVSLETLLVPGELEAEVMRRAGLPPGSCLLLAATHTHSGPGGTWNSLAAEIGGNGRYDRALHDSIAQSAADAVRLAVGSLRLARFHAVSERWSGGPAVSRSGGPVEGRLTALQARDDLGVIGTLVVYGMHPTVVPRGSRTPSGDWPSAAARDIERRTEATALVLQGAGGDATWDRSGLAGDGLAFAEALGARVAEEAMNALAPTPALGGAPLRCEVRLVALPPARASERVPWPLRRGASNLLALFADPYAAVARIEVAGLDLAGVPGEPVGALSRDGVQLVGLADGYLGYVEDPRRAATGEGESARTYYGPGLAVALGIVEADR
jgi:neutral ceramidase